MFTDVSALINHRHHDEPFDDFARQPLLPNKLSQLGPGVSWFDVDGDAREELIVASGGGGSLAVFRNEGSGKFSLLGGAPFDQPVTRDQTAVIGFRDERGKAVLIAGSANWEDGVRNGSVARQYLSDSRTIDTSLPGNDASAGPLAMADIDGDGNLEVFVGARAWPGKYPEHGGSLLFRRVAGAWRLDAENTKALSAAGNVSSAVFADLDADGLPELVLACEWGPIRIFRNRAGKLSEATDALGLGRFTGWWNAVNVGDFDGDGRLDIVGANWGANSKYEMLRARPLRLFYGDFNGDGLVEHVESYYDPASGGYVPARHHDVLVRGMPWLQTKFPTWESVSRISVSELLGERFTSARALEAAWLESTVFLNRGDHFDPVLLPDEAQFAPAFGTCVADFDGDGCEDIFLAQNFFATNPDTSRCDAGRGLLLRGDGQGGFSAMSGTGSGILAYGEQRGAAVCDFDGDGRVDLAFAQNGAETKLYRNANGKPGLRVRLSGPASNPQGIGAVMRLGDGRDWGPARNIHCGAGYWSQDSAVPVLCGSARTKLLVRWPGGKTTISDLPARALQVAVEASGALKVIR